MGTHLSGPSKIRSSTNSLSLKEYLGNEDLPFLFKVLSVRTALSIQAHPDLNLAKRLHESDPKNYRDSNHKPEMAIALGEFEALCGFRRPERIAEFAEEFEGFSDLIGGLETIKLLKESRNSKDSIKIAFEKLMNSKSEQVIQSIKKIPTQEQSDTLTLFHRLNSQYPNDIGVFCVFFLNHFTLKSGEAVFLAANEPHAYLSGSCIECMATSDNVVRAGLTPKHRDVSVLCEMLTYNSFASREELLTKPQSIPKRPFAHLYKSPVPEFSVLRIELPAKSEDSCKDAQMFGKSIIICTEGSAKLSVTKSSSVFHLEFGKVIYLPSNCEYEIVNASEKEACVIYKAFEPK